MVWSRNFEKALSLHSKIHLLFLGFCLISPSMHGFAFSPGKISTLNQALCPVVITRTRGRLPCSPTNQETSSEGSCPFPIVTMSTVLRSSNRQNSKDTTESVSAVTNHMQNGWYVARKGKEGAVSLFSRRWLFPQGSVKSEIKRTLLMPL